MGGGTCRNEPRYRWPRRKVRVPSRPVVVVVCDDTRTAVAYFDVLAREVRMKVTVKVIKASREGATAQDVAATAEEQAAKLKNDRAGDPRDSIWALIDREHEKHNQQRADQAKQTAKGKKYTVMLSNPCYEVWTLAHLIDTGEQFRDCNAVVSRIAKEWERKFHSKFGPKGQADYRKLMPVRTDAVARAEKRCRQPDPSWSEVWQVVKEIDAMK